MVIYFSHFVLYVIHIKNYLNKNIRSLSLGYRDHCSRSCLLHDNEILHIKNNTFNSKGNKFKQELDIRTKTTYKNKTGYEKPTLNPIIKLQIRSTRRQNRYRNIIEVSTAAIPLFTEEYYISVSSKSIFDWHCTKCNKNFKNGIDWSWYYKTKNAFARCPYCYPINQYSSKPELDIYEFICKNYNGAIYWQEKDINRHIIPPYEIDIWIPNLLLGIEFNGTFWHSIEYDNIYHTRYNIKNYHLTKTKLCEDKNITLIHIWEHEWENYTKQLNLKNYLKTLLTNIQLILKQIYQNSLLGEIYFLKQY